jgi:hypothetical protein
MGWSRRECIVCCGTPVELLANVDKGGGHTELAHVFEHNAVVGGVEGALEVCVYDVDVLAVDFCAFNHHDDGGEGVVDVTLEAESVLLVDEYAVGFCVFRACILDKSGPELE